MKDICQIKNNYNNVEIINVNAHVYKKMGAISTNVSGVTDKNLTKYNKFGCQMKNT